MTAVHPLVLALGVPVLIAVALLERRLPGSAARRALRTAVRGGLALLLLGALSGLHVETGTTRPRRLVAAVDRSPALGAAGREEALVEVRRAALEATAAGVPVTLLGFAAEPGRPLPLADGALPEGPAGPWPLSDPAAAATPVPEPPPGAPARPATALAAARLAFRAGETGTVLLLTSGHEGLRDLGAAADRLRGDGIRVVARALPRRLPPSDTAGRPTFRSLDLPARAQGPFALRASVQGTGPLEIEVRVDGTVVAQKPIPEAATVPEAGTPGADPPDGGSGAAREVVVPDIACRPGLHEVAVVLRRAAGPEGPADTEEEVLEQAQVLVERPPTVVAVLDRPESSLARKALEAQGFRVEDLAPAVFPAALAAGGAGGAGLEVVLLDAAGAALLPAPAQEMLRLRVEQGLGLFLEAGDAPAAWASLAATPLGRLLPLRPLPAAQPAAAPPPAPTPPVPGPDPPTPVPEPGLRAERRPEEALPICLLLVLDRSGSMEGRKLSMAIEGARRAAGALARSDRVGVITFADDPTLDVEPTEVGRLGNLGWTLAALRADGNTDIYGALLLAAEVLEKDPAPIRHAILLTDGRQTARQAYFTNLVLRMASAEITLTAVGLGWEHDEVLLKRLVQFSPRGRYVPAESEAEIPTILTRDTQRVAEQRAREAEARIRVPEPGPERPVEPPNPVPPGTGPHAPEGPPDATPGPGTGPEAGLLAPLRLLRPHESTSGISDRDLPEVGPPRASEAVPDAALLLARGEREPVLAGRRYGLGRVLAWALPPDAEGLRGWSDLGRVLVQGVRSVRAPVGLAGPPSGGRVEVGPEGARLVADPGEGEGYRAAWTDGRRTVEVGTLRPGQEVPLPRLPGGGVASVLLVPLDGTPPGPPLTYLEPRAGPRRPRPGDPEGLAAAVGGGQTDGPLLPEPVRTPVPVPLWPWLVALAALLLPLDVALHRPARGSRWTP